MYAKLGYAVVAFDNRGSAGRSLYFQGQIKGQLGEVEVSDQIAGIEYVSREFGVIDKSRIAIEGWSYGGFMSLMALAKRSDVFKVIPTKIWEISHFGNKIQSHFRFWTFFPRNVLGP